MKMLLRCTLLAALPLVATSQVGANQDTGISRQQADQILNELRQIRQLLEQQVFLSFIFIVASRKCSGRHPTLI